MDKLGNVATQAALYQGLVNESSTAVVAVEKQERKVIFANNAWLRQEGIAENTEVVGKRLEELIPAGKLFFTQEEIENLPADKYEASHKQSAIGRPIHVQARSIIWDGVPAYVCYSNDESEMWNNKVMFDAAMKSAKVIIWKYDVINHRISDSGSFGQMYHLPKVIENVPEVFIEQGYIMEESVDDFRELTVRAGAGEAVERDIYALSTNKKDAIWMHIAYSPVYNSDGICVESVGIAVDITERREKEQRYLRQLASMSEVDDKDLIAKGRHNLTTNRVIFYQGNQQGALMMEDQQSYEGAVKKLSLTMVQPEKQAELLKRMDRQQLFQDFAEGKVEGCIQYKRQMNPETIAWVNTRYSLFEEPNTGDVVVFVYSYNVTERVVDQQIISKLSSMEYDALGLLDVKTRQYELRSILKKIEGPKIVGKGDFDERVRKRMPQILLPTERESVMEQMQVSNIIRRLEEKEIYVLNYFVLDDAREVCCKRMMFCYLDETKATILYCRSDITDTYNKEQMQLQRTEDALRQAKKANKAKTEFLSRMSHDIRTPMNTIMNLTKLVREELDDKEMALEDLKKIETSNQFLLSLVNDILDMSRIEQKSMELHAESYSYQEFLNYLYSTFIPLREEKNIELTIEKGERDVDILIDKVRFNQMCFNLLSNAIKYTPPGGHVLFRMVHGEIADGRFPCDIYVVDDGIGMSPEFQKIMFDPFAQEGRSYKAIEGTGLGLSIVKEIVKLLNGTIEVESELNKGTTFHIHLDMSIAPLSVEREPAVTMNMELLQGRHILLAEDHPLNQEIVRRLLEKKGTELTIANNGQEALEFFEREPDKYDLILMDMRMPIVDGIQATRMIRALPVKRAKKIPIIAMTANAFAEDRAETEAAGMNAHLAKPINAAEMYETIISCLQ